MGWLTSRKPIGLQDVQSAQHAPERPGGEVATERRQNPAPIAAKATPKTRSSAGPPLGVLFDDPQTAHPETVRHSIASCERRPSDRPV